MTYLKSTSIAGVAALAGAAASAWDLPIGNQKIVFHGFASQGFLASSEYDYLGDTRNGSLEFNEFGLNATMTPFKRTRIAVQGFAFDLGDVGNHELLLDYASLEYTFADSFGIRGGRVRRPGGIYNHIQDVDIARTSVLLPQGIYDARWRDFSTSLDGGLIFGNIPAGKAGSFSYEAYGGLLNLSEEGGISAQIRNSLPPPPIGSIGDFESILLFGAQIWWATPVPGLRAGLNVGYAPDFTLTTYVQPPFGPGRIDQEISVPSQQVSLEYLWKSWTFQAEYYRAKLDSKTVIGGMTVAEDDSSSDAWYVGAAYRVANWLEVGSYYSEYYADTSDRSGSRRDVKSDAYQKDLALSFRFDIRDWWVMKLEGHYVRGTAQLYDNARNPVRDTDGWFMLAAKTTFSF